MLKNKIKHLKSIEIILKVQQLAPLITMIGELSEGFANPLGELFMQVISNGRNGQSFTPEPISDMIAQMQIGNTIKPGQTVYDGACGSGRMLLAASKSTDIYCYTVVTLMLLVVMALLNMLPFVCSLRKQLQVVKKFSRYLTESGQESFTVKQSIKERAPMLNCRVSAAFFCF